MTRSRLAGVLLLTSLAACSCDGEEKGGDGGAGGNGGSQGNTTSVGTGTGTEPRRFFLRVHDEPAPEIVLDLDRQKALEVFGEEAARHIRLLELDTTPLLQNALAKIQNACGGAWDDLSNPTLDCSLTELGQSFGQNSAEFALVRLLTMTPINANLNGTSLAQAADLINSNYPGLFSKSFGEVLAEALGLDPDLDPGTVPAPVPSVIPADDLVLAMQQNLLATHPEIDGSGKKMPVTLYDALHDMTPLADRLGPVGAPPWDGPGEHPGVLMPDDPSFTTKSNALLPSFRMRVVAESNLRWVSGVDLSHGAGDMFLKSDDSALSFDFNDPRKLEVSGLAEEPTIDMRIALHELPGLVPSCAEAASDFCEDDPGVSPCQSNYPPPLGSPVGDGTIWTIAPWSLEAIIARAAFITYGSRTFSNCYVGSDQGCQLLVNIGQDGAPPGWTRFCHGSILNVELPDPQFLWELLAEVAQIALHDPSGDGTPDIPEGEANPVFPLRALPIGIDSTQLVAEMRPTLQSQADLISQVILGRYWVNNDAVDFFYYRPRPGDDAYLFFVDETDLRPDPRHPSDPKPYMYSNPGFYRSPDLTESSKVSEKVIAGVPDTTHEKYRLPPGETSLFMRDDEGDTYEVRFFVPKGDDAEIVAEVNRL